MKNFLTPPLIITLVLGGVVPVVGGAILESVVPDWRWDHLPFHSVVEGLGDHGCEYMTGGTVVVLGRTGRNFAAGMSGGIAYVLDEQQLFDTRCNLDMVDLEPVWQGQDVETLRDLIARHHEWTGSSRARDILDRWSEMVGKFVKVLPIDYRKALQRIKEAEQRDTDTIPATEEVF